MTDARKAALDALCEITEGGYSNLVLKKHLPGVKSEERAFVTAMVYGTLERLIQLDWQLAQYTDPKKTHKRALCLLRLGAYQLFFMDSVPAYAACDQTVNLARSENLNSGFVNAVMRNLTRNGLKEPPVVKGKEDEYLSIKYSFPVQLMRRWIQEYGYTTARKLAGYKSPSFVTVRPNLLRLSLEELSTRLTAKGAKVTQGALPDTLRISGMDVSQTEEYREGLCTVQGEAAMLATLLAVPDEGDKILDVCSAPGGKALYLSERMQGNCHITAWDVHPHRVQLIRANAARMGCQTIEAAVRDATLPSERYKESFDSVLADVPCSGLGTLWRKPDIKWNFRPETIDELTGVQTQILDNSANFVRPGGILVYCTCTLSKKENEEQVKQFLARDTRYTLDKYDSLPEDFRVLVKDGMLTLLPDKFDTEGFFMARLRRKG